MGEKKQKRRPFFPLKKKVPSFFPYLAAKTFPAALTKQIPTLRRYSCTWRTAATATAEEGEGGPGTAEEEEGIDEREEEEANDDADDDADDVLVEGTAAAACEGEGAPGLRRGAGAAPAEAVARTAERMEGRRARESEGRERESER